MNAELPSESLDALSLKIRDAHALVGGCVRDAVLYAIKAGQLLLEAKAALPHGDWLPWLRKNCEMRQRTAQAYMRMARNAPVLLGEDAQPVADITVRGALALLSKPKTASEKLEPQQCQQGITRSGAKQTQHHGGPLRDPEGSESSEVVGDDDVGPFVRALQHEIDGRLPRCVFLLFATAPIDPAVRDLVEQVFTLGSRLGWTACDSDGIRLVIGRSPRRLATRPGTEVEQAPHVGVDAHSPSLPKESTSGITEPEVDLS